MKKGFTLIELIAVIIVLAVILAIAVPNIINNINKSYSREYSISIKGMEVAAKTYVLTKNVEIEDGSNKIISVDLMVNEGLIDPIIDPKTKDECDGYVEATRTDRNYDYKGYLDCGSSYISDDYGYGDTTDPVITILGNNPVNFIFGETYSDAGATALDNIDGDITSNIQTVSTINPAVPGPYTVTYTVTDNAGNTATAIRNIFIIDNVNPTITFGTNGNATWAKTRSSTVTVSDAGGVNTSTLKYQWTISTTTPTEASFSTTFTNGETISSPAGVTGGYYLWVIGKDNRNNTTISRTNVFNLDNTPPVVTLIGASPINIYQFGSYSDATGVFTAADAHSGVSTTIQTGTVYPDTPGTYTRTCTATDSAGNTSTPVTRTVNIIEIPQVANAPVLATGMTPIKWDGSAWVNTTTSDTGWYSYTTADKKWANAKTADGSMWVWIPRYSYRISSGWHSTTTGTINIQFSIGTDDTKSGMLSIVNTGSANDSNGTFTNHPAFTFGSTQLTGIWVGKFLTSGSTESINVLPSVNALHYSTIDSAFTSIYNMQTNSRYGWGTTGAGIDTHLMKNIEWGADLYIARSNFGINGNIRSNGSTSDTTGCASDSWSTGCQYAYNTTNGLQTSSTGNIYGAYDLGGSFGGENLAAYVNNGHANLTTNGNSLVNAASKYKDVYTVTTDDEMTNFANSINKKGDSIYETGINTSSADHWYGASTCFPYGAGAFFYRGPTGSYGFGCSSGSGSLPAHVVLVISD